MSDSFETLAIHAGQEPDPLTGSVVPPVYLTSTFKQDGVGGLRGGYEYSRSANPTRTALEQCLAAIEGGNRALAFASGMAAEDCLLRTVLKPGDHVLIPDDAYGGTYRLFARVLSGWGIGHTVVPVTDPAAIRDALSATNAKVLWIETPTNPLLNVADIAELADAAHAAGALLVVDNTFASPYLQQPLAFGADFVVHSTTKYLGGHSDVVGGAIIVAERHEDIAEQLAARPVKMVWVETPTNPLLSIADIRALAQAAHEAGAMVVVDNTFASPYLQQPLRLGADAVVHSTTKYLGGHSDVVGGAVVVTDPDLAERIDYVRNATGGVPGPFDSWLTLRGIKTLAVRMDRHCRNAMRVAQMLAAHPAVAEVFYPGLSTHPGHKMAQEQMRAFGGMVSFRLLAGEEAAVRACGRTRLFTLAESLGGVESLIEHPARMTHASVAGSQLEVPGDLIRLSVGIEDCDDLLDDLRQAL